MERFGLVSVGVATVWSVVAISRLVPASVQLARDYHLGHNTVHFILAHLKYQANLTQRQRVILGRYGNEVGTQTLKLDLGSHELGNLRGGIIPATASPEGMIATTSVFQYR